MADLNPDALRLLAALEKGAVPADILAARLQVTTAEVADLLTRAVGLVRPTADQWFALTPAGRALLNGGDIGAAVGAVVRATDGEPTNDAQAWFAAVCSWQADGTEGPVPRVPIDALADWVRCGGELDELAGLALMDALAEMTADRDRWKARAETLMQVINDELRCPDCGNDEACAFACRVGKVRIEMGRDTDGR